jgi:DNA-binding transcriptional regulator GbsR (MarR family)
LQLILTNVSAEFWAVVGTAVAVLVAIGTLQRDLHGRINHLEARMDDIAQRLSRLEGRFDEMSHWTKDLVEALVHRPAA